MVIDFHTSRAASEALAAGFPGRAIAVRADVRDRAQVEALFDEAEEVFGCPVTTVVNNALVDFSFKLVDLQREPVCGDEHPDQDLRVHAAFLAHPDLAQLILIFGFEVERVGSARSAVAALPLLRFPGPPAEPAVRLSTQWALHEDDAVQAAVVASSDPDFGCSGAGCRVSWEGSKFGRTGGSCSNGCGVDAGATIDVVAAEVGVNRETVMRHLPKEGARLRHQGLDEVSVAKARELYLSGETLTKVGAALGVAPGTVARYL